MALETLKGVKKIGGFEVGTTMNDASKSVFVNDQWISFKIQDGLIKENGVNGCQVDTLIHAAKMILEGLNEKFPSEYNRMAISYLEEAIERLEARTRNREKRGVEGTSKA